MNKEQTNEKNLAQQLKAKLNSPEYVAIPEILGHSDRYGGMLAFVYGLKAGESVHSKDRNNFITDKSQEKGDRIIYENQFEPEDWEEIVNLIEKRNKEKEKAFDQRWAEIEKKMNSTPNLYYYWGNARKGERANVWCERKEKWQGIRGFLDFSGKENGRTHYLNIAEEHPVLDNFSFEKGFYLIDTDKPIEKNSPQYWSDGGEENPHNFHKWVEVDDEITITPENGKKLVANHERRASDKSFLATEGQAKDSTRDNSIADNKLVAVKAEIQPSLTENKQLTQILQAIQDLEQRIAELEKSGNNPQQVQVLKQEVKALETQKQAQLTDIKEPDTSTKTNETMVDHNSPKSPNNGLIFLMVGGLLVVGVALIIGYLLGKDKKAAK